MSIRICMLLKLAFYCILLLKKCVCMHFHSFSEEKGEGHKGVRSKEENTGPKSNELTGTFGHRSQNHDPF